MINQTAIDRHKGAKMESRYEQDVREGKASRGAMAELTRLTTHTDECNRNHTTGNDEHDRVHDPRWGCWADFDQHDHADSALRNVLCCLQHSPEAGGSELTFHPDFMNPGEVYPDADEAEEAAAFARISELMEVIIAYRFSRDDITKLTINHSLCPLHFCDWAACFDDADPECEAIRAIYPYGHDT
ncbi:MAG: hypothetical protein DMF62_04940 [Acidobacteria bacterium]|nr:MAG: hypothetical protein DMF62_04940 [Acidobacteriota bacterium]